MGDFGSSCAYVPIRSLEDRTERSFDLVKIASFLQWKVKNWAGSERVYVDSGETYPRLRLEVLKDGLFVICELKSEVIHGSIAILENPTEIKFQHFIRTRDGRDEEVKDVIIYNLLRCYIMVKEELTIKKEGESTSDFLVGCAGNLNKAV